MNRCGWEGVSRGPDGIQVCSLSVGWSVVIELVWRDSEVLDLAVHKEEQLWLWAAVQLGLDPLWMSVWGQLLCGFICQEEKGVVLRVRNFKLVSAYLTHILCCGVRLDLKGFGCAATACILQCHPQVVLNIDKKKFRWKYQNISSSLLP